MGSLHPLGEELVEEIAGFPFMSNDDLVDSTVMALLRFRQVGLYAYQQMNGMMNHNIIIDVSIISDNTHTGSSTPIVDAASSTQWAASTLYWTYGGVVCYTSTTLWRA